MIFLFVSGLAALLASVSAVPSPLVGKRGGNGVHLPIRRSVAGGLNRRGSTGKTGLGDDADVCVALYPMLSYPHETLAIARTTLWSK